MNLPLKELAIKKLPIEKNQISIGLMPLIDSAPIIWAQHRGYFQQFGLNVHLSHEVSWASLRDRLAYGALDAAQCLAPMILAANLGADQVGIPFTSALTLSENWGAITLSNHLVHQLNIANVTGPGQSAQAISEYLQQGHSIKLAHVFQFSMHHFLLREWLSLAGLDWSQDQVSFFTVPPAQMVEQLKRGKIDGFCVGEPWNTVAVSQDIGTVVANAQSIFPQGADKVLGVTQHWAKQYPYTHQAMVAAVMLAQQDLIDPANDIELSELLQHSGIVQLSGTWLSAALEGATAGHRVKFLTGTRAHPEFSDYMWLMVQMLRWQQWNQPLDINDIATQCCDLTCFEQVYQLLLSNQLIVQTHDHSHSSNPCFAPQDAIHYLLHQGWTQQDAEKMLKL